MNKGNVEKDNKTMKEKGRKMVMKAATCTRKMRAKMEKGLNLTHKHRTQDFQVEGRITETFKYYLSVR